MHRSSIRRLALAVVAAGIMAVPVSFVVADAAHAQVAAPAAAPPPATAETPAAAPTGVQTYVIDAKKSVLAVQVFKAGAASAFAHDHLIHATQLSGSIVVDPAEKARARVEVTLPTRGLVNDDPKLRKQYGVSGDISDGDRATVLEHMQADGQLDIEKYPTMSFVSTSATVGEGNKLTLNGALTMHGVTKAISLPVEATVKGQTIDARGSVKLKTSDFGIEPYSALLGAVRNQDGIILHVHLFAQTR